MGLASSSHPGAPHSSRISAATSPAPWDRAGRSTGRSAAARGLGCDCCLICLERLFMNATKILWGQVLVVFAIVLAAIWTATEWTAHALAYQPELGHPWFRLGPWPIYPPPAFRSEEHTSELQSLMRISYAVF